MTIITREVNIKASKERVWNTIADFGNVCKTSPNIKNSYLTSTQKNGVGATRHCDLTTFGATLEERITEWQEGKDNYMKVDIYSWTKIPAIKSMQAEFRVSSNKDGSSKLIASVIYDTKYGFLGNMLNTLMMKPQNKKSWNLFLASIKHHIETGEIVDAKSKIDLKHVKIVN